MLGILNKLVAFDQWLFTLINKHSANPFFDFVLPFFREPVFWVPLYLFLLVFAISNFGKNAWWWALMFLCTFALTDMISTRVFKEAFERLRPCNDPAFADHVRLLLQNCGAGYSFTSTHAANHFGMATFFFITMRHYVGRWVWIGFIWAFFIGYAQIYVGVHYPFDVLGGAVLGILFGLFTGLFFNKKLGFANFGKQPTGTV
jgi:undecaprenyl-diphosphatase